jgi:hypothetical protein
MAHKISRSGGRGRRPGVLSCQPRGMCTGVCSIWFIERMRAASVGLGGGVGRGQPCRVLRHSDSTRLPLLWFNTKRIYYIYYITGLKILFTYSFTTHSFTIFFTRSLHSCLPSFSTSIHIFTTFCSLDHFRSLLLLSVFTLFLHLFTSVTGKEKISMLMSSLFK